MFEDPIGGSYLYCILVKKKGGFLGLKSLSTKFLALLVFMRGLDNGLCYSAEAPVVEGDLSNKYHASISYPTPTISLVFFSTSNNPGPRSPIWSLGNPPAAEWDPRLLLDPQGGLMAMFETPSLSKGPGIMFSATGTVLAIYTSTLPRLLNCMVYLATFSPKN